MSADWQIAALLQWLVDDGENDNDESLQVLGLRNRASLFHPPSRIPGRDLGATMKSGPGQAGPYLLRATKANAVPLLLCRWNLDIEPKELRLRLALFYSDQHGDAVAVGYRYETPDENEDHRMHHVQPINSLHGPSGKLLPGLSPSTPDWGPTMPLAANGPLSLTVCAIISLYGKQEVIPRMRSAIGGVFEAGMKRIA